MFFIDNQNKDLTEVRDKDTGILLGWMPIRAALEPYINFAVPPSLPRRVMSGNSAIDYSNVRFDWANSLALAHNAPFDGAILKWVYGISPKGWLDTLSMGRALHGTNVGGSLSVL